ncbi:Dolichyl-diphosphooligosaccharide--protein glycosyltransferase subunit WBP1 [Dipodascopsis tothii]|uniref:Dolichyl-diphosphooligosaccharide--protein glycosyltransferase subunit WBP1 n=1 Tax=Dipodascopsis tothii TaxID=44089 RepID=UPI0034CEC639
MIRALRIALAAGVAALAGLTAVEARSVAGSRTAVYLDKGLDAADFATFFGDLKDHGFELAMAPGALMAADERQYDHAVVFAASGKADAATAADKLVEFTNAGGNVLVAVSATGVPAALRDFARELDIHLPVRGHSYVDHFAALDEKHEVVALGAESVANTHVVRPGAGPVAYRGTAATLGNRPEVVPILRGSATGYTFDTVEETGAAAEPFAAGSQAFLVAGLQARNNARAVVACSVELFSDASMALGAGNRATALDVAAWAFRERGEIRSAGVSHRLAAGGPANPGIYRIQDEVEYTIALSEWTGAEWAPFAAADVQVEAVMLGPYYRLTLAPAGDADGARNYVARFALPDQHGVFTLRTEYRRPGLAAVEERRQVTVRHSAHNEYLRSFEITNAWVYLASICAVVGGWLVFVVVWLYYGDGAKKTE